MTNTLIAPLKNKANSKRPRKNTVEIFVDWAMEKLRQEPREALPPQLKNLRESKMNTSLLATQREALAGAKDVDSQEQGNEVIYL